MQIRPATRDDFNDLAEIDATIHSNDYLHVERNGEGFEMNWRVEPRPLRERLTLPNRFEDVKFEYRQVIDGIEEGHCLIAEHDSTVVAAIVAIIRPETKLLHVVDVRVDFDQRREGIATAMLFQLTQAAREAEHRAVFAEAPANNMPANGLLLKCGFELSGLDTRRTSNHDLAREITTLMWYSPLD